MKARTIILLWVVCVVLAPVVGGLGIFLDIQDSLTAEIAAASLKIISVILVLFLAVKFLRYPGFKDFLDR